MATSGALGGIVLPTKGHRAKEAALRIGLGWVIGIGWPGGPVLLVACADGRRAEATRKEIARIERMTGKRDADVVAASCFRDGKSASVRRDVASALLPERIMGDLFAVDSERFRAQVSACASAAWCKALGEHERAAAIEDELIGEMV
jgi:hypothetical protein